MAKILLIIHPCSQANRHRKLAERLAELKSRHAIACDLILIEDPRCPIDRSFFREKLSSSEGIQGELSFVEPDNDEIGRLITATNKALQIARDAKIDAIIAGPDSYVDPGAILELRAVGEADPMVGFVEASGAAKSNGVDEEIGRAVISPGESAGALRELPRASYVPVIECPLVLLKWQVLQEFDLLDVAFESFPYALNDLVMRANRCGYRAVRANRAHILRTNEAGPAWRLGASSPFVRDWDLLCSRYPYLMTEISRHERSPDVMARKLLPGLHPGADGRLRILFDCDHLRKFHNGTSELTKHVVTNFIFKYSKIYNIYMRCNRESYEFHGYNLIKNLEYLNGESDVSKHGPFLASIRLAQPFSYADVASVASQAPITMFLMLDTIAMDCLQIAPDVARVWDRMLKSSSVFGFISDFSRVQFARRFSYEADRVSFTALCSTDTQEYRDENCLMVPRDDGYALLVGNSYEHKFLRATCAIFRRQAPNIRLVVLGFKIEDDDRILSYESGQLDNKATADLYAQASLVVFPTHYEGFGLPIMHALAHRKPVIARDLPVFREIRDRIREAGNLHLVRTTEEMVRVAAVKPLWDPREVDPPHPVQNWSAMARAIADALIEAREKVTYSGLRGRLLEAEVCREIAEQEVELAGIKHKLKVAEATYGPEIDESDLPAQAARFVVRRLEARLRGLLARRWLYAVGRSGWNLVKKLRG